MRYVSTFGSFTAARLGIYAAQKGLDVTGHNISNINTEGYTRQVLDQCSLRMGANDRYGSRYDCAVGSGVLLTGVSQIRDPYLDIRFRTEQASVGAMDAKLAGLQDLAAVIDEVGDNDGDGVLQAQFNDFMSQLQAMTNTRVSDDTLIRASGDSLAKLFNYFARELETVQNNRDTILKQDIATANDLMKNIAQLNDQIFKSEIHGNFALEMRDTRNMMIDQLSELMKISVTYEPVQVGAGMTVDKLVIRTDGEKPAKTLVDNEYFGQISFRKVPVKDENGVEPGGAGWIETYEDGPDDYYNLDFSELRDDKDRLLKEKDSVVAKEGLTTAADAEAERKKLQDAADLTNGDNKAGLKTTVTYSVVEVKGKEATDPSTYNIIATTMKESSALEFTDTELYGAIQSGREIMTEKGEFTTQAELALDPNAATKRGIPYYMLALDNLARKFADTFNEANTGYLKDDKGQIVRKEPGVGGAEDTFESFPEVVVDVISVGESRFLVDKDGNIVDDDGDLVAKKNADGTYTTNQGAGTTGKLEELVENDTDNITGNDVAKNLVELGGVLFSNSGDGNDPSDITAANIAVSKDWALGNVRVQNSFTQGVAKPGEPNSGDFSNVEHMVYLMDAKLEYKASEMAPDAVDGDTPYTHGSFQDFLTTLQGTLAKDIKHTTTLLDSYSAAALELDTSRDSVSSVDLNDEAINMMQYQKAYSASCRILTTLDEMLDRLINNTGVAGR